ncbi:sugar kinase [Roseiconus nitratireducens]|uniref:Sugar kinase n=1 Tax=Roseiconus nitratireducens TaxID=2605748 RepID=A0A5M6DBG7_9BACT|nr:sugar kinase [Roseiconus nitratireducens]KAA5543846.1 sugar kinase [Roseiconus nitratireducens]
MTRVVTFGEIMARMACPGYKRFQQAMPGTLNVTFAGAEASIAASIAYLGGDAIFVTALPPHPIADACIADLRSLGLDTSQILRTPQGRLGLYFLEQGANQRPSNIIYDRENSSIAITPPDAYDWDAILQDAEWLVLSGITPALSRNAMEVTMRAASEAASRNVRIACDANYRGKLWRWEPSTEPRQLANRVMRQLMPMVQLFIGGHQDAASILGTEDSLGPIELARELTSKYPQIRRVAMTRREDSSASQNRFGGLLYDQNCDQLYEAPEQHEGYLISHIVDRIGTGDAFAAGLLFALTTPGLETPQTAIRFATAAGCLSHSVEGDFHFGSRAEIESLMNGDATGRVRR